MNKPLIPPPVQGNIADASGRVSIPWTQWFNQVLTQRVSSSLQSVTLTGDVTGSGAASFQVSITLGAVTLPKMAPLAAKSFIGNSGTSAATPQALTGAQAVAMLPAGGDISGTYDAPTVTGLRGKALPVLAAGYLRYGGTTWTYDTTLNATAYQVAGVQVLGAQQTGIGATVPAYTLTGTYATDLARLQALYNQVLALVAALKAHGMVAT